MTRYVLETGGASPQRTISPDDESFLFVSDADWSAPAPNTIEVSYALENNISSGNGETLTGTTIVLVDGVQQYRSTATVSPGDSEPETVTIDGVSAGSHEVCIKEEGESGTGICQDVSVSAPEQDESFLFVADAVWATPSENTIEVAYSLQNNIRSGDGETLTGTTQVTVDGVVEHRSQSTVRPGGSAPENVRISGISEGDHEVCIREEGESGTGICQTVSVEGPPFRESDVTVTSCPSATGGPGESASLDIELRNDNSETARAKVAVKANGTTLGESSLVVDSGTSTDSVPFTLPGDPGDYDLSVTVENADPL